MTGKTVATGVSIGTVVTVLLGITGWTITKLSDGDQRRISTVEVDSKALSERVSRVEVYAVENGKRLERMDEKLDRLLERGK